MTVNATKFSVRRLALLLVAGASLAGCVYYPSGYGYGYGYGYGTGYYAPAYVAPAPVVVVGGGWGHGWWR